MPLSWGEDVFGDFEIIFLQLGSSLHGDLRAVAVCWWTQLLINSNIAYGCNIALFTVHGP